MMTLKEPRKDRAPGDREKIRMTIDLTPEFYDRLQQLEARTYLGNKATVIRHALTIYDFLVRTVEDNGEIVVTQDGKTVSRLDRVALAVAG
jgi:hypothetical protein